MEHERKATQIAEPGERVFGLARGIDENEFYLHGLPHRGRRVPRLGFRAARGFSTGLLARSRHR